MSKITSDILKKLAPRTAMAKRDRFLPFLNEALPRFAINSEMRAASFLATCCFESDYFKTMEEYGKGKGKKYGTVYYGRGIIQNTWRTGYQAFTDYVASSRFYKDKPDFVKNPELLATPFWAVEAACWFWKENNLNSYADKGKFFAIQGLVNRGNPSKKALDYEDRLALYDKALNAIPDDFNLNPIATDPVRNLSSEDSKQTESPLKTTVLVANGSGASGNTESSNNLADNTDSPQNPSDAQTTSISERVTEKISQVGDKIQKVTDKVTSVSNSVSPVSKSSIFITATTKLGGWLLLLFAFLRDNWLEMIIAAVLIGLAVWYFSKAKDRAVSKTLAGMEKK